MKPASKAIKSRKSIRPSSSIVGGGLILPGITTEEWHRRTAEGRAEWQQMSAAARRQLLIRFGALNADSTLRRYPMDHVLLGPDGVTPIGDA
jgi:hypothetical protein